ncbi:unnamed protein product [Calypogeia fissa]
MLSPLQRRSSSSSHCVLLPAPVLSLCSAIPRRGIVSEFRLCFCFSGVSVSLGEEQEDSVGWEGLRHPLVATMSGGFFRGTSADQDTRFSNKMSKLLKSQKFAPELDVLVEMSKVKIDVIKPWIATRVTELLGFEDEVLINFIYGLLDVKEADGKHLQIQLTGFMEKNTGRFMKELWGLLTSAQNNLSGVPQQFLDAKAEEAKKKKEEKDRILSEVMRKKEEQEKEAEEERQRRQLAREESNKANAEKRGSSGSPVKGVDGKSAGRRNGRGGRKTSISPRSSRSPASSPSRGSPPVRHRRSRSISRSPRRRRRSISPFRRRSPIQRRSPPRRRRSPLYSRSPPRRRKSPAGRTPPRLRSRSPPRNSRRSPGSFHSPPRRRGGLLRSPPMRRRSLSGSGSPPVIRRSPSRSPYVRRRSPSRDRVVRRSRSPAPPKRRHSLSRDQAVGPSRSPSRDRVVRRSRSPPKRLRPSRSPYQRRRSSSRELGGPKVRSPNRSHRSSSQERGVRQNGLDARDRDRVSRENDLTERRFDRLDKRDLPDQRQLFSREQDRAASKEVFDTRPSGEKRSHRDLDDRIDPEPAERERSNHREVTRASGKSVPRTQGPNASDEGKKTEERNEIPAKAASDSEDVDVDAPSAQKVVKRVKDVSDGAGDEDGSESPGSSDERRKVKRRRKEEKRLRKEERRKRREERHRRREEKRALRAAKAGEDPDDNIEDIENKRPRLDDNHPEPREALGSPEVYRRKDDESEDEQKRIERELRNKALESLRAKKGIAY